MQKYRSQGWLAKAAVYGAVISLFSIAVFIPGVNSPSTDVIGQNNCYFTANSRGMQAVFNIGIECIYLAEPVNSNISKMQSSKDVIQLYDSSGFYAEKLFPGKCVNFSDNIPRKTFRQVCLVFDIPPPIL